METSITHSKIIREIKPTAAFQATPKNHRLRVAAYCRVSTDHEEQETSMENQIAYYEDLIRSKPEWEYAGVFYDVYNQRLIPFDTKMAVKMIK